MTDRKQTKAPAVSRIYEPAPDDCARAVELLLKASASKEGVFENRSAVKDVREVSHVEHLTSNPSGVDD